jgi:hypothetical protein
MLDINQSYERPLLSRLAVKYTNRDYIASLLFPWVDVPVDRISYPKFDRGVTFKRPSTTVYGARARANELDMKLTKLTKDLRTRGLGAWIDDDERRLAGSLFNAQVFKMEMLKQALLLDLECEIAGLVFNAATYAAANKTTLVGAAQWSDDTSDPKKAVLDAGASMIMDPNTMIVGKQVHNRLLTHPKVLDAVKYTMGGVTVTNEVLARYFGVERYFVGGAFQDTANEGAAEAMGYIWGKFAWIGYVNPNLNAMSMQSAPTFGVLPISRAKGSPWRVYTKAPDPTVGTGDGMEYVKVDGTFDPLFPATDLGFLFSAAIA